MLGGFFMSKQIKVAIIGAGMIANEGHIPAYRACGQDVYLSAVCDCNAEAVARCARRHDIPHFYEKAEEMLEKEKPDLVSITTPNRTHTALTRLALEHGANVLCEKPMAMDYHEAQGLFDLAKDKGLYLISCQTQRFRPEYFYAREYIQDGMLGTPYYGEINRIRRRGIPAWGHFLNKSANGGGALADIGVHAIDAMLWLMGNPKVTGVLGNAAAPIIHSGETVRSSMQESGAFGAKEGSVFIQTQDSDVEEFASGIIRTEGPSINFKIAWAANLPNANRLTILGDKMGIEVPDMHIYSSVGRNQADVVPRVFPLGPWDREAFFGHYYLIDNIVKCLHGKEAMIVTPDEVLNCIAAIDLFYKSVSKGSEALRSELD